MTNKYRNKKIVTKEGTFDSVREYRRWCELVLLERAGEISELQRQVPFELIPAQYENPLPGKKKGKIIERACCYVADFVYREKDGRLVVEDTKGVRTKDYVIKRKLLLKVHGIRIYEV
jgi:hypothetical protein